MGNASQHRLQRVPAEHTAALGERHRHHRGNIHLLLGFHLLNGPQYGFQIEQIEVRFHDEQIGTAVNQTGNLTAISLTKSIPIDTASCRVVHVGRHRQAAVRRPDAASHPAPVAGMFSHPSVNLMASHFGSRHRQLIAVFLQAIIGKRKAVAVERIGFYDVRTGFEISSMY